MANLAATEVTLDLWQNNNGKKINKYYQCNRKAC